MKMKSILVRKKISMEPNLLGNFKDNILNKLKLQFLNKCFKEHGLVLDILPDFTIVENTIISGSILLTIDFNIICDKPEIGDIITCRVRSTRRECILLEIEGRDDILIAVPANKTSLVFSKEKEYYEK